jgi:hypothetical protein
VPPSPPQRIKNTKTQPCSFVVVVVDDFYSAVEQATTVLLALPAADNINIIIIIIIIIMGNSVNSRMTGTDWMRALVGKLLTISHTQWLYRNFSLHNKVNGHLRLTHQTEVLEEIARLSTTRPEDIPEESRFLLEVEMVTLDTTSIAHQEYWITAMKAARSAGRRCPRPHARPQRRHSVRTPRNSRLQRNIHIFQNRLDSILKQMREDLDISYGSWRLKRRQDDEWFQQTTSET